jgi:putative flippase GtrA
MGSSRVDGRPATSTRVDDVRAWSRRPGVRRFSKYAVGSVVAFGASNLAFLLLYGTGATSPQVASVLSFVAGIPVNYVLNRRWAWERRGRPAMRDELVPYAAVVALSVTATAVGTWGVDRLVTEADLPRAVQVALVDVAFVGINGGMFLAKYVLLDRLVFRTRSAPAPASDRPGPGGTAP